MRSAFDRFATSRTAPATTTFPYTTIIAQSAFLRFITEEAARYPTLRLQMGCSVEGVIADHGVIRGVRYWAPDGTHELHAVLTVATDGRFSHIRKLVGMEPKTLSPSIVVLWFRYC